MSDDGPNMENRDPNALNDHLGVQFDEILGEVEPAHSLDCVWRNSYKCFNLWLKICYLIATTLCGIFIAICWGCYFACVAFCHVWQITPCMKAYSINIAIFAKVYSIVIHSCCDPCCEAFGKCFEAFKK